MYNICEVLHGISIGGPEGEIYKNVKDTPIKTASISASRSQIQTL